MGEIRTVKLESLVAPVKHALSTGPFGSAISSKFFLESGVPVIRGTNLSLDVDTRLNESAYVFISNEKAEQFSRSAARPGDLIFTCWGTVGQVGIIPRNSAYEEYIISNKQMKLTPNPDLVDSLYLYYYLSSPGAQAYLQGVSIGSSVPGFNLGQLRNFPVALPSVSEQRAISELLNALDEKIHTNESLAIKADAMAEAHYAHARRGVSTSGVLSDWALTQYGATLSGQNAGSHRLIRVTDINKKPWVEHEGSPWVEPSQAEVNKYLLQEGDILVARMADPGKVGYIDPGTPDSVFASYLVRVKPKERDLGLYVYYFLRSREYVAYAEMVGGGSVQKNINARTIVNAKFPAPTVEDLDTFNVIVRKLRALIGKAREENQAIVQIRDTLLPKLIEGTLTVRTAEDLVSEAV